MRLGDGYIRAWGCKVSFGIKVSTSLHLEVFVFALLLFLDS